VDVKTERFVGLRFCQYFTVTFTVLKIVSTVSVSKNYCHFDI